MITVNARKISFGILLGLITIFYTSCKSKKLVVQKEEPVKEVVEAPKPVEPVKEVDTDGDGIPDSKDDCPEVKGTVENHGCPEEVAKVFNYQNIQFEFNSSVLKTSSYAALEVIAQQMKKNPSSKFLLNGHSSSEGTDQRNMMLSVDRANAVKVYLVNNGIKASSLITKGFGEAQPVADNSTEEGRATNRRVEIKPEK